MGGIPEHNQFVCGMVNQQKSCRVCIEERCLHCTQVILQAAANIKWQHLKVKMTAGMYL
jgi:hypothetical protein